MRVRLLTPWGPGLPRAPHPFGPALLLVFVLLAVLLVAWLVGGPELAVRVLAGWCV